MASAVAHRTHNYFSLAPATNIFLIPAGPHNARAALPSLPPPPKNLAEVNKLRAQEKETGPQLVVEGRAGREKIIS